MDLSQHFGVRDIPLSVKIHSENSTRLAHTARLWERGLSEALARIVSSYVHIVARRSGAGST